MLTPSLPNHAGCQIDHSQNNAIFSIQFPFSCSKICRITPSRFALEGGLLGYTISNTLVNVRCSKYTLYMNCSMLLTCFDLLTDVSTKYCEMNFKNILEQPSQCDAPSSIHSVWCMKYHSHRSPLPHTVDELRNQPSYSKHVFSFTKQCSLE